MPRIELLGPPTKAELEPLIREIQSEGGHYLSSAPKLRWTYPQVTLDPIGVDTEKDPLI